MHSDQQGIRLNNVTAKGAELYMEALDQIAYYHPESQGTLDTAIEENPEFALPYFAKIYNLLASTQSSFERIARETMAEFTANISVDALNNHERAHLEALNAWMAGDLYRAKRTLDRIGKTEPRDFLSLRMGHKLDFITGDTRNLRDRIARQLNQWSDDDHHVGSVYGCYSYALVENGRYEEAADWGFRALQKNPRDVWGLHAVVHSFEMRGMIGAGCKFMTSRTSDWGYENTLRVHNWWHYGLFHLDQLDYASALQIYDDAVFNDETPKIALSLNDASSLLWRIYLDGEDLGGRFEPVASAWATVIGDPPISAFNEIHAIMALVGANRLDEARRVIRRLSEFLRMSTQESENKLLIQRIALPVCEAFLAFAESNFTRTFDLLSDVRLNVMGIGGSTAQRDVIERTMVEAAIRAKLPEEALALTSERTVINSKNPHNWSRAAEAMRLAKREREAVEAATRVEALIGNCKAISTGTTSASK